MQGLYKSEEMTIENINDKEAKIAFLQKAIDVTGNFKAILILNSKDYKLIYYKYRICHWRYNFC